jgi:HEAT repeat protein
LTGRRGVARFFGHAHPETTLSAYATSRPIPAVLLLLGGLFVASARAGDAALAACLERLQADDVLVADAAVEEIAEFGSAGVEALLPLLDDDRRDVRAGAIRGLGLLADPRAADPVRRVLEGTLGRPEPDTLADRYFRILAIQALGRIGDRGSAPLLREIATSGDEFERAHAGISLFLSGEDPGYDLARECLADTAMAVRNLVVAGLGESDDPRARDLILPMTRDASWVVRDSAYWALRGWSNDSREVAAALREGRNDPSWYVRQTVDRVMEARKGE